MTKEIYSKRKINYIAKLVREGSTITSAVRQLCDKEGVEYHENIRKRFSYHINKRGLSKKEGVEQSKSFINAKMKMHDRTKQRFLISWCQSETDIHHQLLENMEAYAKEIDAQILIIAGRYKNPTSISSSRNIEQKEKHFKDSWHKRVIPYLDAARHKIHKHLVVLSDVKIQPTASMPLTSLNGLTGIESCIVGSPKSHLKFLPVLDGYPSKLLITTGSVSVPNYTDTKVGKLSEFNHHFGCVIVELDGEIFHIRQITADEQGNFYDLCYRLKDGEVTLSKKVEAVILGDIHLGAEDKRSVEASFEMMKLYNPNHVILHDIMDGSSISHHEKHNPFQLLKREEDGSNSLQKEIDYMIEWFEKYPKYNYVIPSANHNDFVDRWLQTADWRKEGNKKLYLKLANIAAEGLAPKGIVAYLLETKFDHIKCLGVDESYVVKNIELSCHGDRGASGSRGSAIQFRNLNVKTVTAHTHSASKMDGHNCVGTLTKMRMGYNLGMSAWSVSNLIIHLDGRTQHIHLTRGKYTTFY